MCEAGRPLAAPRFAFLAALLLVCGGWTQAAWLAAADDPPIPMTTVQGTVVDEAGASVEGIEVSRHYRDVRVTSRTDASGRFAIEVPTEAPSTRALVARDDTGEWQGYFRFGEGPLTPEVAPRIVLRKSRQVAVTVIGADQRTITGVDVAVLSSYWPICNGKTDENGKVVLKVPAEAPLDSVFAHQPDVGFDYQLYRRAEELANDPYRLPQNHVAPLTLTLAGTRTITVRVVDEAGQPLAGAKVYPFYIECPKKGGIFQIGMFAQNTDREGSAVFRIVPSSNLAIISFRAKLDGYDLVQRWELDPANPSNEITGTMVRLVPLVGTVKNSQGGPVAESSVSVVGDGYQSEGFRGTAISQADGTFKILVKPNHYYVLAAAQGTSASPIKRLMLRSGQTPEAVQLVLQPATRILGTLTSKDDGKPLADRFVSLRSDDGLYYFKLPKDQQLPNPFDDHKTLSPALYQSMRSGPMGEFEFLAGPGNYSVSSTEVPKGVKFELKGEPELVVNLQATEMRPFPFVGRVVSAENPQRGLAEVAVTGWSTQPILRGNLKAVSDTSGKFEVLRFPTEMYLFAKTSNGLLAGIIKVAADTKDVVIPIGPLASARGRLVDAATGLPLPGQRIEYGFRIELKSGGWMTQFGGGTMTDERGEFKVVGLVPGFPYETSVVLDLGPEGRPRSWQPVSTVTAKKAELVELGDVTLPSPRATILRN